MKRLKKKQLLASCTFAVGPVKVMRRVDLSTGAKTAYSVLLGLAEKDSDRITISEKEAAFEYGVPSRSFCRHARELASNSIITIERRSGRPNIYIFLSLEEPGQADLFEEAEKEDETPTKFGKGTQEAPTKFDETPTKFSRSKQDTPTKSGRGTPTKSGRGQAAISIKSGEPEEAEENAASNFYDTADSLELAKTDESAVAAAAAFLTKHFPDRKTRAKLLGKYGSGKILHTQRHFEAKTGKIKNAPGLIRHLLDVPASDAKIASAVAEQLGKFRKAGEAQERAAEARDRARESKAAPRLTIWDWLDAQTDADTLREAANRHVAVFARNADFKTLLNLKSGYLWKIRKQRERQKQPIGTEVAEA